jgi:hypothetical protein
MPKAKKVLLTERAVIQRINRKLASEHQQLKTYRGGRWESDLGRFYVVDLNRNAIVAQHVVLDELARELGAIAGYEAIEEVDDAR